MVQKLRKKKWLQNAYHVINKKGVTVKNNIACFSKKQAMFYQINVMPLPHLRFYTSRGHCINFLWGKI